MRNRNGFSFILVSLDNLRIKIQISKQNGISSFANEAEKG